MKPHCAQTSKETEPRAEPNRWHEILALTKPFCYKTVRENRLFSTPLPARHAALTPETSPVTAPALVADRAPPSARPVPWYRSPWFDFAQFAVLSGAASWMIVRGARGMGYDWQWAKVPRLLYRFVDGELVWGPLMKGLFVTLDIAWIAMLLTIAIGLVTAVLRLSESIVGRAIAQVYIEVIRNTPLLVQILIFYFIIGRILGIPRALGWNTLSRLLRRGIRGRDHSGRDHRRAQGPSRRRAAAWDS